jgi:peptidoglycan/LPS O-acetylase OafA/YrhL
MSDDEPKPPLEYRNYTDDAPERKRSFGTFIGGMAIGVAVIVVWGCANFTLPEFQPPKHHRLVAAFGCVGVSAAVIGVTQLRAPRRRFLLAGFLLGAALTCLVEGICYFG